MPTPRPARAAGAITVGMEEEFVLMDPATRPLPWPPPELVRMPDGKPGCSRS